MIMYKKGFIKILLNLVLILIVACLVFAVYFVYTNYVNPNPENLEIRHYSEISKNYPNLSNEIKQFYPNMRFRHKQITFDISERCNDDKKDKVLEALQIIEDRTGIRFLSTNNEPEVKVLCSKEEKEEAENEFVAGEGGPTRIIESTYYPLILQARIILYDRTDCEEPITELHELMHVFGFEHINNSKDVLYPYLQCGQELNSEMIDYLEELYSIAPLPEIYFINISAVKSGVYLDFNLEIRNIGLEDIKNVTLKVYGDGKFTEKFDLGEMEYGAGKAFSVNYMKLPSHKVKVIKFELEIKEQEYDKTNNEIELEIKEQN